TGAAIGVWGSSASANGYGGYFNGRGYFSGNVGIGNPSPTAALDVNGVVHVSGSAAGGIISGTNTAPSGPAYGVYGQSDSVDRYGVYGKSTGTVGTGVRGECMGSTGTGVYGFGNFYGVVGEN